MDASGADRLLAGSIPEGCDRYLVPLFFECHALDLARRVARLRPNRGLEPAAGTGVVTRSMAQALPDATEPRKANSSARHGALPKESEHAYTDTGCR